ncbi:MAG: hypothetical protein OJF51_002038 [Nitrospira sp.]|jgi:hypothetical protein|nr:MAG: hypothetical protein OJF51_002038 [Nitrospira sp.]
MWAAFITACTSGDTTETVAPIIRSGDNRPPMVTSAIILDASLSQAAPVAVQIQSEDPEREAVSFEFQWYVDNTPISRQTNAALPSELLKRGQTVFVEIIPSDGANKGQPYRTKSVVMGNTAPRVSAVSLSPQMARMGDKLQAQVEANDPDHDRVDLTYKWYRNETVIKEGEESFIDTTGLVARDRITVEVTAHDPAATGNSLKSEPLVLENSAPKIISTPPISDSQGRFDYAVKAMDPDSDQVMYYLEAAPTGMSISETSGHILWQISPDQKGIFHVKVVAKDGHGGIATQEFDLTLTSAEPTKPPGT